jgi:predicted ATPase
MKQYILTGGPGCGKTSAILELEKSHKKYIIHESAESIIRIYMARGHEKPWEISGFQNDIWMLTRRRILTVPVYVDEVFHDRYFIDCIAYAKHTKTYHEIPQNYVDNINTKIPVFFFEQLDTCEKNKIRREDDALAKEMSEKILNEYETHGFNLIIVKKAPLKERIEFILNYIKEQNL